MSDAPNATEIVTRPSALGRVVLWLLVFAPALFTGYQVHKHAVDVPVWDDWERVQLLGKHYAGELDLEFLASGHIDHRPLLPRLLTVILNGATGGDLRAEMWVGFGAMLVAALLLAALVARGLPPGPWRWATAFCLNLFLFSPVQYQNFLWGTQMAYLLPLMFLCLALWAMSHPSLTAVGKVVLGAGAATLATYCFGHGLVVWPVVVCMALLARGGGGAVQRLATAGALLAIAAAVVGMYFGWNYVNTSHPAHAFGQEPGERPPGIENIGETLGTEKGRGRVGQYFFTSLGNAYARVFQSDPAAAAERLGKWAMALFLALVGWAFWRGRGQRDFDAVLPWLAAGGFAVSNALLGSLGRAAISLDRAILPRYLSSTQFLGLALVGGGALVLHRWGRSGLAAGLAVAVAALHVPSWDYGLHKMGAWRQARLAEQFALSYMQVSPPDAVSRIDKETAWAQVEEGVAMMAERGLLDFEVVGEWGWGGIAPRDRDLPKSRADVWRAVLVGEDMLAVEGWAEFGGDGNRAADGVIFTYRTGPGDDWQVFAIAETNPLMAPWAFIADGHFGAPSPSYSKQKNAVGWGGSVGLSALPASGEVEVKAWAVDMAKREAVGLKTRFTLDRSATRPGDVLVDRAKVR